MDESFTMESELHDAIVAKLEQYVNEVYMPTEPFKSSIEAWNGVPIVYAQEHTEPKLWRRNPQEAIRVVNGEVAGVVTGAKINTDGTPRLEAKMDLSHRKALDLLKANKLGISPAFRGNTVLGEDGKKRIAGNIVPENVLIFELGPKDQPQDAGTMFLNKKPREEDSMAEDESIKQDYAGMLTMQSAKVAELEETVSGLKASAEALKTSHEEELAGLRAKLGEAEQIIESSKKKEADELFESIVAQLPPGYSHTEEDKAKLRELFDAEPHQFAHKIATIKVDTPDNTGQEGEEFLHKKKKEEELEATFNDWRKLTGGM